MTTSFDNPQVSIVLPVFNEIEHLDEELERIRDAMEASQYSFEIIVVDDASTDGSTERLDEIPWIRLIAFRANRGPGAARKIGTEAALGEIVLWSDVDMSYPNDQLPRLVEALDGYDQVVGARTSEEGTHKLARVPAKWFIRRLAEWLSSTKIPDLNSGFRAFRKDVADQFLHLLPNGFSHVTTMTMVFLANGYSVGYVDIDYAQRSGNSKFRFVADTRLYLRQVTRMVMMWNPLRVLTPLATVLFLLGFSKLVFDLIDKDFRVGTNTLLVVLSAGMIFVVALLADLVVQVTRPRHSVLPAAVQERGIGPGNDTTDSADELP
ncbi:MAG: glycosyltransferase family 2 protein [Actinobacteria bacterium]|nr:MAG: glycosyltransferase family 2 protein [Actinomycetota bacterium]